MINLKKIIIIYTSTIVYMMFLNYYLEHLFSVDTYTYQGNILIELLYIIFILVCNHYIFKLRIRNNFSSNSILDTLIYSIPIIIYIPIIIVMIISYKGPIENIFFSSVLTMTVSFFEEYFFRGMLLGTLIFSKIPKNNNKFSVSYNVTLSLLISSAIFSLSHMTNLINNNNITIILPQLIFTFSIGLVLGMQYIRSGNLVSSFLLHSVVDFPSFLYLSKTLQQSDIISRNIFDKKLLMVSTIVFILCSTYVFIFINKQEDSHYNLLIKQN